MDANNPITAAVFSAFLNCPTKAHLLAIGAQSPDSYFADIEARISSMYKAAAQQELRVGVEVAETLDFGQLERKFDYQTTTHYVDCQTAVYKFPWPRRPKERQTHLSARSRTFVPVLFSPSDKPDISDKIRLCFGALGLAQRSEIVADTGTLIYGDGHRHKSVKIADHVPRTLRVIDAIEATRCGREPPPLILNRHCAVCDFQPRCRGVAIEREDLSLLTAMTSKERAKCNAKGLFTITQLSYGYRPRRRKRARPDAERSTVTEKRAAPVTKNDHKLKALSIKKNQIHVVGSPLLKLEGVPVFLDVEGMPDRDFYYLVGLRFEYAGEKVERSFWADGLDSERAMWESCLGRTQGDCESPDRKLRRI